MDREEFVKYCTENGTDIRGPMDVGHLETIARLAEDGGAMKGITPEIANVIISAYKFGGHGYLE